MTAIKPQCTYCTFWEKEPLSDTMGQCRLREPKLFCIGTQRGPMQVTAWPSTKHNQWCGEFEPKESNDGLTQ